MKKITMMAGLFLLGAAAYAADNKITMVTYFPTPYMAYQDVTVSGPCDIGLISSCQLNVAKDLQTKLMSVGEGSTLTLKGHDAEANVLKSGQGSASRGSLVFEKGLTVTTLPGSVQALETEEGTIAGLNLGSKAFPTCTATGNKISWKDLTINGQAGVYLVCGEGTTATCTKTCPTGQTLNQETCECEGDCNLPSHLINGSCVSPSTVCCMVSTQGGPVRMTQTQSWDEEQQKFYYSTGPCCHNVTTGGYGGVAAYTYFTCNDNCEDEPSSPSGCTNYTIKWKMTGHGQGGSHTEGGSGPCSYPVNYWSMSNVLSSRPTAGSTCSPADKQWYYLTNDSLCQVEIWYCTKECAD